MKFSYAIGNPPYQETKGGTKNVDIWPDFIRETKKISKKMCMIHPGRWVIPKKNMVSNRDSMIKLGLAKFNYFITKPVFNNVGIDGGITMTYFTDEPIDKIQYTVDDNYSGIYDIYASVFISDIYEYEAYNKIWNKISNNNSIRGRVYGQIGSIGYGFGYVKSKHLEQLQKTTDKLKDPIKVWANAGYGLGSSSRYMYQYIDRDKLDNIPSEVTESRKVMINSTGRPVSYGGCVNVIHNIPTIVDKNTIGENVLFIIPNNDTDRELNLVKSLFFTKTARFLLSITEKDHCVRGFENIPDYLELAKLLPEDQLFTDKWFYKTFNFSDSLINYIESHVSEKVENKEE